jgi:hypothetical protein
MDINEDPTIQTRSRYEEVTRRMFLRRAARAAGALAVLPLISACGDDSSAFATSTTLAGAPTSAGSTTGGTESTPATTAAPTTTTVAQETSGVGAVTDEIVIAFTYAASSGGRVQNPYVAVWVEDSNGELVATVALWFLQTQKGLRWLTDLRRWYSVDGSTTAIDTLSGATRTPGDYKVSWDMTDVDGGEVVAGEYYVCIEAAREHGPYSLIRQAVTLEAGMDPVHLVDDGELTNASVTTA